MNDYVIVSDKRIFDKRDKSNEGDKMLKINENNVEYKFFYCSIGENCLSDKVFF